MLIIPRACVHGSTPVRSSCLGATRRTIDTTTRLTASSASSTPHTRYKAQCLFAVSFQDVTDGMVVVTALLHLGLRRHERVMCGWCLYCLLRSSECYCWR